MNLIHNNSHKLDEDCDENNNKTAKKERKKLILNKNNRKKKKNCKIQKWCLRKYNWGIGNEDSGRCDSSTVDGSCISSSRVASETRMLWWLYTRFLVVVTKRMSGHEMTASCHHSGPYISPHKTPLALRGPASVLLFSMAYPGDDWDFSGWNGSGVCGLLATDIGADFGTLEFIMTDQLPRWRTGVGCKIGAVIVAWDDPGGFNSGNLMF